MSQQPLSSNFDAAEQIEEREMRLLLHSYFEKQAPPRPLEQLKRALRDPFQEGKEGRFRLNPLWLILSMFLLMALLSFVFFSFGSILHP